MDNYTDGSTMLFTEPDAKVGRHIASFDNFTAREMVMTLPKVQWLWQEMVKYRTLWSDLTSGSVQTFAALVRDPSSFWIEILRDDELVGVLYFTNMQWQIDCEVHIVFFDRKPREKAELCRLVVRWLFDNFPLNRVTATIPKIYYATLSFAKLIGFKKEGVKRQSQLMGNKWVDEVILGLLRSEVQ